MTVINLKYLPEINVNKLVTSTLPAVTTAILVVVIANNMASITWEMFPSTPETAAPLVAASHNTTIKTTSISNRNNVYKQIPNWHLFGTVQKDRPKIAPTPVAPKEVPDTQLRLTLKGVVASADMMDAWAIIADRMGNEDSYGIESTLPGGATLKEIYADRIILLHNGRLETLRLPTSNLTGSNASSPNSSRSNRRSSTKRNVNRRVTSSRSSGNVNRVSSAGTATLKQYRDKIINDPQSVMNTVRAEPYRQAGRLKGYRIFPGRDKNLFGQIGLEPGDVVTSVNGIVLDSPLKGLEIMQNVTDATEVSVEVLRNGVSQTFMAPMN